MNQISCSPSLPLLVANEIVVPSGEIAQPRACSRSLVGSSPSTETAQMLAVAELQSEDSSVEGSTLTMNLVLSGNQGSRFTSHFTLLSFSASGLGTVRVSPVSMNLTCSPRVS